MNQTGKDVQDYNIDEHSDSYKTLLQHNTPPAAAVWWQLMSAWNARIYQLTDDTNGKRHIKTLLQRVLTCILQQLWACWWITLTHKRDWTFSSTWGHLILNASFSGDYYSRSWHTRQPERPFNVIRTPLHSFTVKQWLMTGSCTLLGISTSHIHGVPSGLCQSLGECSLG